MSTSAPKMKMPTSGEVERELLKMEKRSGSVVLDRDEGPIMKKKVTWAPYKSFHRYIKKLTGTLSSWYGKFLTENPWVVILINLFFASLLLCGLFIRESLDDFEALMTPNNSVSLKDRNTISSLFYTHEDEDYVPSHNPYPPLYAEVIITPLEEDANLLDDNYLQQIFALESFVYSEIELQIQGRVYKYSDLCAKRNGLCVKQGITKYLPSHKLDLDSLMTELMKEDMEEARRHELFQFARNLSWPVQDDDFLPAFISNTSVDANNKLTGANAVKLRWYLRQSADTGAYDKSLKWMTNFEARVSGFEHSVNFAEHIGNGPIKIRITYAMSESLNMLLNSAPEHDTDLFIFSYIFVLAFTMLITGGTNWVTTRSLLAGVDVLALGMATVAALGMVGMLGIAFVNSVSIMPLLVIGNGLDDLFIFMSAWKKTTQGACEEKRVSQTLRKAGYPITISSVTSVLAFLLSTFTEFENINNFCFYSASAVAWCFVVQMTFFGSCLAIHARRVNRYRHCVTCMRAKTRYHMKREGERNPLKLLCCAGNQRETNEEIDSIMQRIVHNHAIKVLLNPVSKCVVLILYVAYIAAACYGVKMTERGVSLFSIVEPSSPYAQHLISSNEHFDQTGIPLMVVFTDSVNYHNIEDQKKIEKLTEALYSYELIQRNFTISWLDKYKASKRYPASNDSIGDQYKFGKHLKDFLDNDDIGQHYQDDVVMIEENNKFIITASRIHFQAKNLWNSDFILASDFMMNVRSIADKSDLPAIVFSGIFIYYEQYNYLIKTAIEVLAFSVLALFAISVLLVPSLLIAIIMTFTVISINVGVLGFMYFLRMKFSIVTLIDVILSSAYVMDFAVHICLGYMESSKEGSRNERVREAMESNGVPIFNGALCTSAAISVFAMAKSYLFKSFFKTCLLVIGLGVVHCLIFTPVILSVIGPHKTKKKDPMMEVARTLSSQPVATNRFGTEDDFPFYERPGFLAQTSTPNHLGGAVPLRIGSISTRNGGGGAGVDDVAGSDVDGRCVSVQTSQVNVNHDLSSPRAAHSTSKVPTRPPPRRPVNNLPGAPPAVQPRMMTRSQAADSGVYSNTNVGYQGFNLQGSVNSIASAANPYVVDNETKV